MTTKLGRRGGCTDATSRAGIVRTMVASRPTRVAVLTVRSRTVSSQEIRNHRLEERDVREEGAVIGIRDHREFGVGYLLIHLAGVVDGHQFVAVADEYQSRGGDCGEVSCRVVQRGCPHLLESDEERLPTAGPVDLIQPGGPVGMVASQPCRIDIR